MRNKATLAVALGVAVADLICLAVLPNEAGHLVLFASVLLAFSLLGIALLRRARVRAATLAVLGAATLLYGLYLSSTGFAERNYDAHAHLHYTRALADRHVVPLAKDCTICHHPPLYHLLAAGVVTAVGPSGTVSAPFALQVFSLGLFLVFLSFGTLALERLVSDPRLQPWGAAFLAFWPMSVINSVRLNNDLLVFALMAACLYYVVRWRREQSPASFVIACALALAACLTKLNGLILVAGLGGLVAWDLLRRRSPWKGTLPVFAALVLLVATAGGVRAWRETGDFSRRALGSAAVEDPGKTPRSLQVYVQFNLGRFLAEPYSIANHLDPSQNPYWEHLLKSSLFGTRNQFEWGEGPTFSSNRTLARVEAGLLIALMAYVLAAAGFIRKVPRDHRALSLYFGALFLVAAVAFHVWAPKPHHTDFRFIFPVLIPAGAIVLEAVEALRRRSRAAGLLGRFLLVAFWSVSIAFFVTAVRPTWKHLVERVKPSPTVEQPKPSPLRRFQFGKPPAGPSSASRSP